MKKNIYNYTMHNLILYFFKYFFYFIYLSLYTSILILIILTTFSSILKLRFKLLNKKTTKDKFQYFFHKFLKISIYNCNQKLID